MVQFRRIKSRLCALQETINQSCASPLTSPKCGSDTQICHHFEEMCQLQSFIV